MLEEVLSADELAARAAVAKAESDVAAKELEEAIAAMPNAATGSIPAMKRLNEARAVLTSSQRRGEYLAQLQLREVEPGVQADAPWVAEALVELAAKKRARQAKSAAVEKAEMAAREQKLAAEAAERGAAERLAAEEEEVAVAERAAAEKAAAEKAEKVAAEKAAAAGIPKPSDAAINRLFGKVGGSLEQALNPADGTLEWRSNGLDEGDAAVVAYILSESAGALTALK